MSTYTDTRTQAEEDQEYLRLRENEEQQQIEHNNNQNKTDMNTGTFTSTIKVVKEIKGDGQMWRGVYYHMLEMDNGDKINIGKKKHLTVGETLNYEVEEIGQQEYNKAKSWNPEFNGNSQAPAPSNPTSAKQGSQNASFCLAYAKDVFVAHGGESPDNSIKGTSEYITGLADEFLTWLNNN